MQAVLILRLTQSNDLRSSRLAACATCSWRPCELDPAESLVLDGARRRRRGDLEFSTRLAGQRERQEGFTTFMTDGGPGRGGVGRDHRPGHRWHHQNERKIYHLRPTQYEGLANKLIEKQVLVKAKEPRRAVVAAPVLLGARAPDDRLLIFFMRQMQSGGTRRCRSARARRSSRRARRRR